MTVGPEYVTKALRIGGVPDSTISKFLKYHNENREVWRWFEVFARSAANSGKKLGAKAVMERVRWEVEINSGDEFKANNNFTAYYARVFAVKYPQFENYFETRAVRGLSQAEATV